MTERGENMITAEQLLALFVLALDELWGYIWGTAGITWTQARQNQKVEYMVSKYGSNWKNNKDAKADNYYSAAMYGSKWIGHTVADCSGLFAWAFKKLGGAIAHGSNSIYDRYCTTKGKLTDTLKKTLIPGTAVFTGDAKNHGHIGLYIGNGKVIEASGTQAGVCTSNITAGKWTYYGLLKNVSYNDEIAQDIPSVPSDDKILYPTIRRGNKGENVVILQTLLSDRGYNLGSYGIDGDFGPATENAVRTFQKDHGLTVDGIAGPKTWAALIGDAKEDKYTVTVTGLTKYQADELAGKYPTAKIQKEG